MMEKISKRELIHFIGIGGIGVSAIARLCLSKGAQVQGSDQILSVSTYELEETGVRDEITMHYYNWMKKNKMYVVKSGIQPPEPMARPYNRVAELRQKYGWLQIHKEGIWFGRYMMLEGKNKKHYRIYGNPRDADNYR